MPKHYKSKGSLTAGQQKELLDHSAHHSKGHMNVMRSEMKKGMSFQASHEKAMKKAGK